MGRKNYDSLPPKYRPLPNRTNVILTRQDGFKAKDCIILNTIDAAVSFAKEKGENELFIIGGGQIYEQSLGLADRVYLTEIHEDYQGDTFFPELGPEWKEKTRKFHDVDLKHSASFDFVVYEKNNK